MKRLIIALVFMMGIIISVTSMAADEVVISERYVPESRVRGQLLNIHGAQVSSWPMDITEGSQQYQASGFDAGTEYIMICNNSANAIWYTIGAATISANANKFGNEILFSYWCREEPVEPGQYISTAADS